MAKFTDKPGISFAILDYGSPQIIAAKFRDGALRATDMMEPLAKISLDMMEVEKRIWTSKGRRGGNPWPALAPSTVEKKGGRTTILVDTGQLKRSVTEPGAPWQILEMSRYSLGFGTDRPWAFTHQYGSEGVFAGGRMLKNDVPQREFIKYIPNDYTRWNKIIVDYLLKPFMDRVPTKDIIEDG